MTERHIIVVDVETSGLIPGHDVAVEVAWWDLATDERGCFVPVHDVAWVLEHGDEQALKINGYRERLQHATQDICQTGLNALAVRMTGQQWAGSKPDFDVAFVQPLITQRGWTIGKPHHRLRDLASYAGGVLGLPPPDLPGLQQVCELLDITNHAPHTAEGDVDATGRCFRKLFKLAGVTGESA